MAGIVSPISDYYNYYCPDQAWVDEQCLDNSFYCGKTCTPILGLPYDPHTGLVNLVGSETRMTCARCCCGLPWERFTREGDFLITEVVAASGLPNRPAAVIPVVLLVALVAGMVLFRIRSVTKYLPCVITVALLGLSATASAQEPLDLSNPGTRMVWVHFEESSNPTAVGQTFGPPFPATYSVDGNTGTLVVDAIWHRQLRNIGANVGDVSPLIYEFDLLFRIRSRETLDQG